MQNAGDEYACLCMCSVRVSCACLPVYMQCVSAWWRPQNACTGCVCRGVCKGVPVCDDGEAGLLSFNTVLPGHWAVCKCTELTAEAQSSLVHPPTSSPPPPPSASLPPSDYPVWLTARVVPWNRGTNTNMAQDVCRGAKAPSLSWSAGNRA